MYLYLSLKYCLLYIYAYKLTIYTYTIYMCIYNICIFMYVLFKGYVCVCVCHVVVVVYFCNGFLYVRFVSYIFMAFSSDEFFFVYVCMFKCVYYILYIMIAGWVWITYVFYALHLSIVLDLINIYLFMLYTAMNKKRALLVDLIWLVLICSIYTSFIYGLMYCFDYRAKSI